MFGHLNPLVDLRRGFGSLARNIPEFRAGSRQVQLGRSLIAAAQLLTLTLTSWTNLTADALGRTPTGYCEGVRRVSLLCVGGETPTELGRWAGVIIALLVLSGLWPRFTSILHAWLALSMSVSLSLPDGGEPAAVFSTVLLVAVLVPDRRMNGWSSRDCDASPQLKAIGYAASIALCLQLAGIYFESGLAKLAVTEWADGSAMFYISRDPMFGSVGLIATLVQGITDVLLGTALLTWGTITAEVAIAVLFLCPAPIKKYGLLGIIALHSAIAITMGLWSFSLTMIGAAVVAAYTLLPARRRAVDTYATDRAESAGGGAKTGESDRRELVNS